MAYNPNYTRYSTDRMVVTGTLSANGTTITYTDNEGTEHENTNIATLFTSFWNKDVELVISTQVSSNNEGNSYVDPNANNA